MQLKSFKEFLNEEYLALEAIEYIDRAIFKPFMAGKYNMTDAELKKWENKQHIIKEDDDKYWLDNDEEIELIKKYQSDPNSPEGREAINTIIEKNVPYIKSKVGKFIATHPMVLNNRQSREDLEQECLIQLTKAIEKYDESKNPIFKGFLNKYINGVLLNANNPGRQKSIDVDGKGDSKGNNKVSTVSMDTTVGGDNGEYADKEESLSDKIADDSIRQPWEQSAEDESNHIAILHDWYELLPEKEKTAMLMYFPTDRDTEPATMDEIGAAIGMSKMGVKKLIDRIILKLRGLAEKEGIVDPADTAKDPEFYDRLVKMAKGKKSI